MKLGPDLRYDPGWQAVEDDLYDIAKRVQEYDDKALLVREVGTGRFGIAHFNEFDDCHTLAAVCKDPASPQRFLTGCPDGRVLSFMRIADGHRRISNLNAWVRKRRDGLAMEREAWKNSFADQHEAMAREMAWRRARVDLGQTTFASIPKGIS